MPETIVEALADDLNTPKAIAALHKLYRAGHFEELRAALEFLGFSGERAKIERVKQDGAASATDTGEVDALIAARLAARQAKDFKEADRIRDELQAMGIVLKDAKDPETGELVTTWEVAR